MICELNLKAVCTRLIKIHLDIDILHLEQRLKIHYNFEVQMKKWVAICQYMTLAT